MSDSAGTFLNFAQRLLEQEGALAERIEPEGLELMLSAPLQTALRAPEFLRLGFGAELPPDAERVSLESDWLERFSALLGNAGGHARLIAEITPTPPGGIERIVERNVILQNAIYRLNGARPAWTRYVILLFRYTAVSDEKREGLIRLGVNTINGSSIDAFAERLYMGLVHGDIPVTPFGPPDNELPAAWPPEKLRACTRRALPARVRGHLGQFLGGMQRRLDRDLARVHEYYESLRQEAWRRIQKQKGDAAREQLRIDAAEREYQAKVADLRQKYDLRVSVELVQTLELLCPVQRVDLLIRRRKGERHLMLDWNPIARELDPLPCEWSGTHDLPRVVCDDRLHLVSPAGHAPCPQCQREYCRACHPRQCPACKQNAPAAGA
ncbi:MAG: hypothetical protein ACKV2V_26885 [Blastocatellia bacterium]